MLEIISVFLSLLAIGAIAGHIVYEDKKNRILFIKFNIILGVIGIGVGLLIKSYLVS
jgi:uncharacterized membrane protein YeaQ/YmgE (transglycosylase-associated protein family)